MSRRPRHVHLIPVGLFCAFGVACGDDDDGAVGVDTDITTTTTPTTTTATTETDTDGETDTEAPIEGSMLRVIHAVPGAAPVDVFVEGEETPLVSNLAYGETSEYVEVPEGENRLELRVAGTSNIPNGASLATDTINVAPNQRITAVAAGQVESENGDLRILAFEEGFEQPAAGNARVRVVHAGADAPTVGIDLGDDGTVEIESLDRFAATDVAGVDLPAGEELQVGIVANGETVTSFTTPALPDGGELFVIATGLLSDLPRQETGFALLPVTPDGSLERVRQNPRVFALHAAPTAPQVDVCAGDMLLVENLAFDANEAIGSIQVRPDEYDLTIQAGGEDCGGVPLLEITTPMLEPGEQYLAVVGGQALPPIPGVPSDGLFIALSQEMFSLESPDQAVIRLLHAALAPPVVAGLVSDGAIVDINVFATELSQGDETGELPPFDPNNYTIGLSTDEVSPYQVIAQGDVELTGGERSWLVITGNAAQLDENGDEQLRFRVVDSSEPREWSVRDVLLSAP